MTALFFLLSAPWPFPRGPVLVISPHPDDETLACGGLISRALRAGLPVYVAVVTEGEGYSKAIRRFFRTSKITPEQRRLFSLAREIECRRALRALGVPGGHVFFLGYPSWSTSLLWFFWWGKGRVALPGALHEGAPLEPEALLADIEWVIRRARPSLILIPSGMDTHPTHWAVHNFSLLAISEASRGRPLVLSYLVHYPGWPIPYNFSPSTSLPPPRELAGKVKWLSLGLTPEEERAKERALLSYRTQLAASPRLMLSFVRRNELFHLEPPPEADRVRFGEGPFAEIRWKGGWLELRLRHRPQRGERLLVQVVMGRRRAFGLLRHWEERMLKLPPSSKEVRLKVPPRLFKGAREVALCAYDVSGGRIKGWTPALLLSPPRLLVKSKINRTK